MPNLWLREPALTLGAVGALIALAVGFGLPVTPEQTGAILAAVSALLGVLTRSAVTPASSVVAVKKDGGLVAGPAATVVPVGSPIAVVKP